MTSATFDTHFFIKRLTTAGVPEQQAEIIIDSIREFKEVDNSSLATKGDMQSIKADLRELELRLQNQTQALQLRIGAMVMALGGMLIAIKYFG